MTCFVGYESQTYIFTTMSTKIQLFPGVEQYLGVYQHFGEAPKSGRPHKNLNFLQFFPFFLMFDGKSWEEQLCSGGNTQHL